MLSAPSVSCHCYHLDPVPRIAAVVSQVSRRLSRTLVGPRRCRRNPPRPRLLLPRRRHRLQWIRWCTRLEDDVLGDLEMVKTIGIE